jgi:hypothetical protein
MHPTGSFLPSAGMLISRMTQSMVWVARMRILCSTAFGE